MVQNMYGDGTIGALTRSVRAEGGLDMNECGRRPIKRCADWSGAAVGSRPRRQGWQNEVWGGREEGRYEGRKNEHSRRKEGRTATRVLYVRINKRLQKNKTRFICLRPEFVCLRPESRRPPFSPRTTPQIYLFPGL